MSWIVRIGAVWAGMVALVLLAMPSVSSGWPGAPGLEGWRFAGALMLGVGTALALASPDPMRHWRLLVSALAAKLAGAAALISAGLQRPVGTGNLLSVAAIDLGWAVLLGLIVTKAWHAERAVEDVVRGASIRPLEPVLGRFRTQAGEPLAELTRRGPAMLVFLRHAGCTFCRQTLHDLSRVQEEISREGVRTVLVHHSSPGSLEALRERYELAEVELVEDPARRLYRTFGLGAGGVTQLYSPEVGIKGLWSGMVRGHGIGRPDGDVAQMPGIFVVHRNRVFYSYYHRNAADRPDFREICVTALRRIEDEAATRG